MMESLGNRLRQLRQNNRLRQAQVASLVGVNKNTMCSYENDVRQPSYEILVRLATIYRVSTDYLLGCESKRTVDVSGLTPKEIQTMHSHEIVDLNRDFIKNSQYIPMKCLT